MRVESDFLVFGSGIAGLSYALKAAECGRVIIVTKSAPETSATAWAQGGIASVFSKEDSFKQHILDTKKAGADLCNEKAVDIAVKEGPDRVRELIEMGVPFSKNQNFSADQDFEFDLTREGGHTARRILHADDYTGQAIEKTLLEKVASHPNIRIFDHHTAIDLVTNVSRLLQKNPSRTELPEKIKALGMYVLDQKTGEIHIFQSPILVLATGGAGKVYLYTTNPDTATGDGIAIGSRAGARVANMEFFQFHPTCLFHPNAKSFLISEALRGEGGVLINSKGEEFVKKSHTMGSLASRDIVARAIDTEIKRSGASCVFLDMTKLSASFLRERFPNIFEQCLKFGIDMSTTPIPVVPAAHYLCGGLWTNENGETSIENLFAIGEVACTGLHGANRLASNSLLEGAVFAHRAFLKSKEIFESEKSNKSRKQNLPDSLPEWDHGRAVALEERINIDHTWREIRTLMWNYVAIVRSNSRLEKAKARLSLIKNDVREYYWNFRLSRDLIELRNLVTVSNLIVECALLRKESRGLHYNLDYPNRDDVFFKKDTLI